ncbi:hypothetical protein [Nitrosovibrio sp. Nv6]|uniref:hypothetical protein n=1 Tax=Nitrosovibrio sp. Nv6 TaxID=1855340 RepID=UPI0008C3790A|nr:hypothetical protein [Nitrosovibrio sp. Nv6]SEO64404.1 phage tail tape measure protein, lambda family [Nitrosovibrio sp. Nv6]
MSDKNIDVDISADASGYRRGAEEAKKITRDLNAEFDKSNNTLSTIGSVATRMGGVIAGAASIAGAGLAVAGGGALLLAKNVATTASEMANLSKKTGVSAEDLGAWRLATAQSGTNLEGLAVGLKNVAKYMVEHEDNLRKLGITAKTSEGVLIQLAGVLSSMPDDDPRKMALANEILSKSYQEMMPLLAEGEDGLRKLLERGRELNPVTNEMAKEANYFSGQLEELKLVAAGLGASLASTLLPHLNDILSSMRSAARESGILSALWAGMGGVAAHALGLDDITKARDRLREINSELATAAQMPGLTNSVSDLLKERSSIEAFLNPPKVSAARAAPSDGVLKGILNPDKSTRKASSSSGTGTSSVYLDEIRDLAELMKEVGKLTEGEKSHLQVLQEKVDAYSSLDPAVKNYLQTTIDQAAQMERLEVFESESKKLLEENKNLNVGLIESDRERVLAQLELEHQRSIERINALKLESSQVEALIDQETKNYELRMKKAQMGTEKTTDLVKSLGLHFSSSFENAIVGGEKFSNVLLALERDLERMLARQLVTKPLLGGLETLMNGVIGSLLGGFGGGGGGNMAVSTGGVTGFAANGAWFDGSASYFANGGIFDKPTAFRFGNGGRLGVMGEAGPEAILPLKRGSNGQLGVQAGGGANINVQVNLIESPGNGGEVQQRQDGDGNLTMDIMVEQIEGKMGRNIARGNGLAPTLEHKYGLNPAAGAMR